MNSEAYDRYDHKVVSLEVLKQRVGGFPRKNKIVLCHGCFDVVHPGHLHHLLASKSKAEILVVSVTSDRFIKKGDDRPFVPEYLRALNLAAFEAVDYVVVTDMETPIELLLELKPDYFAKGFEYTDNAVNELTQEEIKTLDSFGGEMLFTPGDIVYSSTELVEKAKPNIRYQRFYSLLKRHGINLEKVRECVQSLSSFSVHVVGDLIVDSYTYTTVIGSKAKTPTLSVKQLYQDQYIGGAGIVAKHLAAAGSSVCLSTVLGEDELGAWAEKELSSGDIDVRPLFDNKRPTTNKNAIIADGYRLLKLDSLSNDVISMQMLDRLVNQIAEVKSDAIVFSDFRHGIFNRDTVPLLTAAIPSGVFKVADSQVASRWGNICEFKGFNLITPNENEARFALGDQDSVIGALCSKLVDISGCEMLVLKLGKQGLLASRPYGGLIKDQYFGLDSFTDNSVDPVGAGDSLMSYVTLSMLATNNEVISSIIGAIAAACECEREGNIPITPDMVLGKLDALIDHI